MLSLNAINYNVGSAKTRGNSNTRPVNWKLYKTNEVTGDKNKMWNLTIKFQKTGRQHHFKVYRQIPSSLDKVFDSNRMSLVTRAKVPHHVRSEHNQHPSVADQHQSEGYKSWQKESLFQREKKQVSGEMRSPSCRISSADLAKGWANLLFSETKQTILSSSLRMRVNTLYCCH